MGPSQKPASFAGRETVVVGVVSCKTVLGGMHRRGRLCQVDGRYMSIPSTATTSIPAIWCCMQDNSLHTYLDLIDFLSYKPIYIHTPLFPVNAAFPWFPWFP